MKAKYILISGSKQNAKQALIAGDFIVWNDNNVKSAFSLGQGTMDDFKRFSIDNTRYSTNIDIDTLTYIDTGEPCDINRKLINIVFSKYNIEK